MPVLNDALIPPTPPADACSLDVGKLIAMMIGGTQISSGVSLDNVVISNDPPGINERGKLWYPPNIGRLYHFSNSLWISKIYPPALSQRRMFWTGSAEELWAEDEGSNRNPATDPPTQYSGAVWEVDPDFTGRTAIGAGEVPGTTPPVTLIQGESYGAGHVKLNTSNTPEHWHFISRNEQLNSGAAALGPSNTLAFSGGGFGAENYVLLGHTDLTNKPANVGQTSKFGTKEADQTPVNIIPPSVAGFWARRTIRAYYVILP